MVSSSAATVEQYLAELNENDRATVIKLRELFKKHLPKGLEEVMNWGMITYQVPFSTVPKTYNNQPLAFAAIARQKNYFSIYLMPIYADESLGQGFESEYVATGKKLNVGKACIRFKNLESLPIDLVGKYLSRVSVEEFINQYSSLRSLRKQVEK